MKSTIQYSEQSGHTVAVLTLDIPPMNAEASGVRGGLDQHMKHALTDGTISAVVLTGARGVFGAGADIMECGESEEAREEIVRIIAEIERSVKPVVAAIDGLSLGSGFELALGCHYRVASERAIAGLPEVNLGLLPSTGGTQRLPRLIGVEASIDFITRGKKVDAAAALQLGIYDSVVHGDFSKLVRCAVDLASSKVNSDISARRLSALTAKPVAADYVERKRKDCEAARPGEHAPQRIISCILAATDRPFAEGMAMEATEFARLQGGDQANALQHMLFAERECSKIPGLIEKPGPLNVAGIVGAGSMGGGIAMCCAEAGMRVLLMDIDALAVEKGMAVIRKNYARSVERSSKTQIAVDSILALIEPTTRYADLAACDIVIESVFENVELKQQVQKCLDAACKPGCLIASGTGSLDIDKIASASSRPEDVIGVHFFSPANVMHLLEIVRGAKSSDRTIATAMAFGKKIKKTSCLVRNCPGFCANRVMGGVGHLPGSNLVNTGVLPHDVDVAAEAFGMKMGPYRMNDLIGLDLFGRERVEAGIATPEVNVSDALYAAGRLGQKAGKGFYTYDERRKASFDSEAQRIISAVWKNLGVNHRRLDPESIAQELYFPVINEGFRCLEEGIVIRASDIDVCVVFGYNWPRYRGGPMQYAMAVGLPRVVAVLERMGEQPSALLKKCAEKGWKVDSKELVEYVHNSITTYANTRHASSQASRPLHPIVVNSSRTAQLVENQSIGAVGHSKL